MEPARHTRVRSEDSDWGKVIKGPWCEAFHGLGFLSSSSPVAVLQRKAK